MQHARIPCLPPPRACSDSCPLSQWCHPTISSSVVPFSYCLQSFPALGSFPMSQFFTSGAPVATASASVLPMNVQNWFPLGWTGLISCSPRNSHESSPTSQFKSINSSAFSLLYGPTLTSIHDYWKNHSFDYTVLCQWSNLSWLFNMLSRFVIGKGNGTPLQYSCLENPWMEQPGRLQSMGSLRVRHDWATSLSLFTFTFHFHALEKEMATHSSVLAWRIPGKGKNGGLPSMGSHRVRHDWSDLGAAAAGLS